eukprot:899123_1
MTSRSSAHTKIQRITDLKNALKGPKIDPIAIWTLVFSGIPDGSSLRSTCWKIMLGYLSDDRSEWPSQLANFRKVYRTFIENYGKANPFRESFEDEAKMSHNEPDVDLSDPLGVAPGSKWTEHFENEAQRNQIHK